MYVEMPLKKALSLSLSITLFTLISYYATELLLYSQKISPILGMLSLIILLATSLRNFFRREPFYLSAYLTGILISLIPYLTKLV